MTQEFTQEQQEQIVEILSRHEEALLKRVAAAIQEAQSAADAEYSAQGLTFTQHSPANADYLSAFLFGKLFDGLHKGDKSLGELILTMEAKRLGIQ
ncbi:hypothetical protein AB4K05_10500 [Kluyvera sp. STS39-E]|uniref:hypothetical protein n=1 Tax=Kluyvera sp. STS39-E TaxID=3234748 RepID=UPI0034C68929